MANGILRFLINVVKSIFPYSFHTVKGPVGAHTFKHLQAPTTVYYPAPQRQSSNASQQAARWLPSGLWNISDGYLHAYGGMVTGRLCRQNRGILYRFLSFIIQCISFLNPLNYATIDNCIVDCEPEQGRGKLPVLIWSHGLTGTSDEHRLMAATLASEGFIVVLVHHTDGSSSKVELSEGGTLYYEHHAMQLGLGPYPKDMRTRQVKHREEEVWAARQIFCSAETTLAKGSILANLRAVTDTDNVFVGGFSYGAATASLATVTRPGAYRAVVLFDGWFHIDFTKSIQWEMDFPAESHAQGLKVPSLFLGSRHFQSVAKLNDATVRLQTKCPSPEVHVLPQTRHHNFCDLVWWFPRGMLSRACMVGQADPIETYHTVISLTLDFLNRNKTC